MIESRRSRAPDDPFSIDVYIVGFVTGQRGGVFGGVPVVYVLVAVMPIELFASPDPQEPYGILSHSSDAIKRKTVRRIVVLKKDVSQLLAEGRMPPYR